MQERLESWLELWGKCIAVPISEIDMAEAFKDLDTSKIWIVLFQNVVVFKHVVGPD